MADADGNTSAPFPPRNNSKYYSKDKTIIVPFGYLVFLVH